MDVKKAEKVLLERISVSRIIETHDFKDCVEFVVDRWGDICTFRVYRNGDVTER